MEVLLGKLIVLLCYCLKLATGYIGSGALGRDSDAGQCQMLPVADPGHLCGSINDPQFAVPLLVLLAHKKDPAVHQGWILPELGPGLFSKRPKAPRGLALPASTCWLPVSLSLKEPLAELLSKM